MATVESSTQSHFLLNGRPYPRVYTVYPYGARDAMLSTPGQVSHRIEFGSDVNGMTPATQAALVAALTTVVYVSESGGGGGGSSEADKMEDSQHFSGAVGSFVLVVRSDSNVPMADDGDYCPLVVDSQNRLKVAVSGGGDASAANQAILNNQIGSQVETPAASDTAPSGLNGLFKRMLARITEALNVLPATRGASGGLHVEWTPSSSAFPVTGTLGHGMTVIGQGRVEVPTAGAAAPLSSTSMPCKWVVVQAKTNNTGLIAVGGSGVSANESMGTGLLLEAGESTTVPIDNAQKIFIDATVSGEGARFVRLS